MDTLSGKLVGPIRKSRVPPAGNLKGLCWETGGALSPGADRALARNLHNGVPNREADGPQRETGGPQLGGWGAEVVEQAGPLTGSLMGSPAGELAGPQAGKLVGPYQRAVGP